MTIYKPKPTEKKENASAPPEVVINEPLIVKAKVAAAKPRVAPVIIVDAGQRRRTRTFVNCCIFLNALILVVAGIMGGLYLYKHMRKHAVYSGKCGTNYYEYQQNDYYRGDAIDAQNRRLDSHVDGRIVGHFDEDVELDVDGGVYEKIDVPEFLDCRRATILHDFERNTTAVIDKDEARCFVMPLDRELVKPPKDLWDLITKLRTGYYLPDEQVVRQKFYVKLPPVQDLSPYGFFIYKQCRFYDTYQLVPSEAIKQGRVRRDAQSCSFAELHYSFTGAAGADRLGIADIVGCAV